MDLDLPSQFDLVSIDTSSRDRRKEGLGKLQERSGDGWEVVAMTRDERDNLAVLLQRPIAASSKVTSGGTR